MFVSFPAFQIAFVLCALHKGLSREVENNGDPTGLAAVRAERDGV